MSTRELGWAMKNDHVRAIDRVIDFFGESRDVAVALITTAAAIYVRGEAWVTIATTLGRAGSRAGR